MADTRLPLSDWEGLRLFGSAILLAHQFLGVHGARRSLTTADVDRLEADLSRIGADAVTMEKAKQLRLADFIFGTWDLWERQELVLFLIEPDVVNWYSREWLEPIWYNCALFNHMRYLTDLFFDYAQEGDDSEITNTDLPPGYEVFSRLTRNLTKPERGKGAPKGRRWEDALNSAVSVAVLARYEDSQLDRMEAARLALTVYPWANPTHETLDLRYVVVANSELAAIKLIADEVKKTEEQELRDLEEDMGLVVETAQ